MLTRKQYLLLSFIDQRLKLSGVSPSFDEMKDALGLKSKSGIHRLIKGLEERGFLKRLPHRARALEVLRLPCNLTFDGDGEALDNGQPAPLFGGPLPETGFSPQVIRGNFTPTLPSTQVPQVLFTESISLPLLGKIAAGTPIAALIDPTSSIDVPASMVRGGEHFALRIEGDSMIEAGILSGDLAVVRRCDEAENGTVIVALVDNEEATLKRLRRKGASIALEPANRAFKTQIYGPDRVRIQGRLVGLIRSY
ncbi:repressor LexA [Rhodospirillum rubrum]|uniref:transcriptional repressor LexA n=1 Tax=Rhodospirillum rubrum TaxID=1085 RepID=UPI001903B9C3|nr:transcriptional repressor LexA [Rhodospirillum rubrum]MBK1663682.1 repressor LexA [Rhodospirillum rubrum]MBK1676000.1 repressor LexA [Rhodospirillum rubrum]